jgi:hypothetical protein
MSLKTRLIAALVAMGLTNLADKIHGQTQHFNVPDPKLTPKKHKKSAGGKGGSSHTWGLRPRPRHRIRPATPCYVAPPPRNKHRTPNKLQMIERIKNGSDSMCGVLADSWHVPLSHVIEAKRRAIDINIREFAKRIPTQRAMIVQLGGDPDAGDGLEFVMDEVRLVRAYTPNETSTRQIHIAGEQVMRNVRVR